MISNGNRSDERELPAIAHRLDIIPRGLLCLATLSRRTSAHTHTRTNDITRRVSGRMDKMLG